MTQPSAPPPRHAPPPSPDEKANRLKGIAFACGVMALYTSFVLISRASLIATLAPADVAALRFGVSGLLLAPVLLRHGLSGLRPAQALALASLGGLGFSLFAYSGFSLAPASHGSVLIHGPLALATAILLRLFAAQPVAVRQWPAFLLVALGVAAMAWEGLRSASIGMLLGDLSLLGASFCWAGYGIYVRHLGLPAVRAAAIVACLSGLIFLPVYALFAGDGLLRAEWRDLLTQGLFQGVLIGVVSIFLYTRAVLLLGAPALALFLAAVPGLTVVGAVFLLGETAGPATLAGLGLVTLGMAAGLLRTLETKPGLKARR